jgi:ATP-dependent Clp protease ATP-binding subunit ClpB
VGIQLKRVEKLLSEQKIKLYLSDAALDHLVEAGYDPVYGARPIKRAIQRELENAIATKLLEQTFTEGDTIQVEWENDQLVFQKQHSSTPITAKIEPTLPAEAVEKLPLK